MRSPARTQLFAVFQNEVLLNSKRIVPYVLMLLSVCNALLWTVGLGATYTGQESIAKFGRLWAINSDYYITHNFTGFSVGIFGLPILTALIMAEPVRRDFRLEIDSLIFSKPVSKAHYLLGKFFGSFFVLVCCQVAFAVTLILLQLFHTSQMVVLPFRLIPYLKHFMMIVVITYLLFAAIYFTVGTLTRNPKIVYVLAIAYYPLIFLYAFLLGYLPPRWRVILSPLMLKEVQIQTWGRSPEWLDQLVVSYTPVMFANRALVILATAVCLTIVCRRFKINEPTAKPENFSRLNLSAGSEVVYFDPPILQPTVGSVRVEKAEAKEIAVPSFSSSNTGLRANLTKLAAALGVEFRLLRAERSLIVITPLAVFLPMLQLAFFRVVPEASYSATYATGTAKTLLFFLIGMTVFYLLESMQRDREVRIEPVLWTKPTPNFVLLLSKFLATFLLMLSVLAIAALTAIAIQLIRGHTPVELYPYFVTYSLILIPTIVFMAGVSILLNVVLRDKYLAYVVIVGVGAGLFYLYSQGYNHWLYNPMLYQLWNYADLTGAGSNQSIILVHRVYCLAASVACLALAHILFQRKSTRGLRMDGHLTDRGWSILLALVSLTTAIGTGWIISSMH